MQLLVNFLKAKLNKVDKIVYMSDGAPTQYKNRFNVFNVCFHEKDFGIRAEWHYFATSHGKGPSDVLGGTVKRLATKASLQRPYDNQILTPQQLYEWASDNFDNINFSFAFKEEVAVHTQKMKRRLKNAPSVTGIRSFHACIPHESGHATFRRTPSPKIKLSLIYWEIMMKVQRTNHNLNLQY